MSKGVKCIVISSYDYFLHLLRILTALLASEEELKQIDRGIDCIAGIGKVILCGAVEERDVGDGLHSKKEEAGEEKRQLKITHIFNYLKLIFAHASDERTYSERRYSKLSITQW